jgi:carboxypeptidase D
MRLFTPLSSRWRRKVTALLALTAVAGMVPSVSADKTAADYFVHSLPGAPEGVPLLKMHAGYVESLSIASMMMPVFLPLPVFF